MTFSSFKLSSPILQAITDIGYSKATPIQSQAIPVVLSGNDMIAVAQTGTGKTASFVLPMLEQIYKRYKKTDKPLRAKRIRALVLVPTRELAAQIKQSIVKLSKHLNVTCMAMYGGLAVQEQKQQLIWGVDILVATPGRLLDMIHQRALHFDALDMLVFDEADRMLDMGFIDDINKIIERLPQSRQNLLFSATMSNEIKGLVKTAIYKPVEINVAKSETTQPNISQWLVTVDKSEKSALLSYLVKTYAWQQAIIFIETKHGAAKLVSQLEKRGIIAQSIHSGKTQPIRENILADFKAGRINYLVSTGIAARGIDIDGLSCVINYDLPAKADEYVHRIGRTGRAGASGEAVSLVSKDNFRELCRIETYLGHIIERKAFVEFPVKKVVPVSILNYITKYSASHNK